MVRISLQLSSAGIEGRLSHFLLFLSTDSMTLRDDLDISLDLSQATIALTAMLKVATTSFFEFPVRDLFNLDCWLATMPAPELNAQGIRLSGV